MEPQFDDDDSVMTYSIEDIFLAVPTRGSLNFNHVTAMYALMASNPGLNQPELSMGSLGVCHVRNDLVRKFLSTDAKVLFFVDDDVVVRPEVLEMRRHLGEFDIVGAPYMMVRPPAIPIPTPCAFRKVREHAYKPLENVFALTGIHPCDAIGTGCMMIKREVLETPGLMPFRLGLDTNGIMRMTEDMRFCEMAVEKGLKIGADFDQVADHLHTLSLTAVHQAYVKALNKALDNERQLVVA